MTEKIVLITGCTGFIGRHLITKLAKQNYRIYAIVRDVKKIEQIFLNNSEVMEKTTFIQGDLTTQVCTLSKEIKEKMASGEIYVINLVGGGPLTANKKLYNSIYTLNVITLKNLFKILEETDEIKDVRMFVHLSSLAAMGALNSNSIYTPQTSCCPVLPYEIAKYDSEKVVKKFANKYEFKAVILRPPQVYGKNSKEFLNIINLIKRGIFPLPKGAGSLPLIHVEDLREIIVKILNNEKKVDNITIMLPCEKSYPYSEIESIVKEHYGSGRIVYLPYFIMYILALLLEITYPNLFTMPEPFNRYRLKSVLRKRIVRDDKIKDLLSYECKWNLRKFLRSLNYT